MTTSKSSARAESVQVKKPAGKQPGAIGGKYNIGSATGNGRYRVDSNDDSPAGTQYQGFIKRSLVTPFGTRSWWEKKNQ